MKNLGYKYREQSLIIEISKNLCRSNQITGNQQRCMIHEPEIGTVIRCNAIVAHTIRVCARFEKIRNSAYVYK